MKRATWAAFAIGLVLGLGCGAAKVLPGATTILVKVHLIAAQNIDQLYVTGTVNGFDEFPRTYLPPDAGAPFNGPQSFRIFLADSEAGKTVEVDVFGVAEGTPVAAGTATVTVVKQQEVEADIDLSPNMDGGTGGGAGGGSGMGGGVGGGGGTSSCGCDGGCCQAGSNACLQPKQIALTRLGASTSGGIFQANECGAAATVCSDSCDPLRAVSCTAGKCSCGPNLTCHAGERCVVSGMMGNQTFACRCDAFSNCQGCCVNGATCVPPAAQDGGHCGASGDQCQQCNGGLDSNCAEGVCGVRTCQMGQCASANDCADTQFPTCVGALTSRCTACDPIRSNRCSIYVAPADGCACGNSHQCAANEYCDNDNSCQPLF